MIVLVGVGWNGGRGRNVVGTFDGGGRVGKRRTRSRSVNEGNRKKKVFLKHEDSKGKWKQKFGGIFGGGGGDFCRGARGRKTG